MKTRIVKILIPTLIIIFAAVYGLNNKLPSTAFAIGDLIVDWGIGIGNVGPIFNISNFAPGDFEERIVSVTNSAISSRNVAVRGIEAAESGNLSDGLNIEIIEGVNTLYGPKTLTEFFVDSGGPNGIPLSVLASSTGTSYKFKVTFPSGSGNGFQGGEIIFNLKIGIYFDLPSECDEINFAGDPIFGTSGNDNIRGTSANELIIDFEGNDRIRSGGGNDCILAGEGNDVLDGGTGDDVISGEGGNDRIDASSGNDIVFGGSGNDNLEGGSGNDELFGEDGIDNLKGGSGNDLLVGGPDQDAAVGGTGTDTCEAESRATCEL